jgi:WSC domain/Ricin-type beta-trefoil lectin domain/Glycosyl hydrolases family 32 N-terminal domain
MARHARICIAAVVTVLCGCSAQGERRTHATSGLSDLPSGQLTRFAGNPLLRNGPESYDAGKTGPRVVRKEGPSTYRMWYEAVGATTTVAYATSSDGASWTKRGVVMSPSASWEADEVSPGAILVEDGVMKLWYHAGGNAQKRFIGYATSTDSGLTWTKRANPVLTTGAAGSFDDFIVAEPRVFHLSDGSYRMYYTGSQGASSFGTGLGMATSGDGISWTKYAGGQPILQASAWGNFWGGAFFYENGLWFVWAGDSPDGSTSRLKFMWSTDGIRWSPGDSNPVLVPSTDPGAADYALVGDSVSGYRDGDTYRILYTGFNWNLFGSQGRFEGICMASISAATCTPNTTCTGRCGVVSDGCGGTVTCGACPSSSYVGCFSDAPTRALPAQLASGGATPDACTSAARADGYRYAGVQYYGECWAGNALGYAPAPDSDCNLPCSADPTKTCGGAWRNSIYEAGGAATPSAITIASKKERTPSACIDVPGGNAYAGQRLQVWDCNGGTGQRFVWAGSQLQYAANRGLCLSLDGNTIARNGTRVTLQPCANESRMSWRQTAAGEIESVMLDEDGKRSCVDIWYDNPVNGQAIDSWECYGTSNQAWSFTPP